jgi:tetratricopeptide (TPR) repeat protein
MMDTLYDLLGALPHDDAEGLRTAFRKAVKGAHPDLRPDDPDAALKFRQIVRANEILGDAEERATYDHLLELARLEQVSASKHAIAATVYKVASGVIALAGASVVTVGGYLLFIHISAASIAPANEADLTTLASNEIATISPAVPPATAETSAPEAKPETAIIAREALAPIPTMPPNGPESFPARKTVPASDLAASEARALRARGISAYRNGNLDGAIADLDRALQLDPKFLPAYIDRGIIVYRMRKFGRAFADITESKRIDKASPSKSVPATVRKPHVDQAAITPLLTPSSQRRKAAQKPSREEYPPLWVR